MLKKLLPTIMIATFTLGLLSSCIVHTRGRGCGHGARWNGNRCVSTVNNNRNRHRHPPKKKDKVIIHDNRR
jgi:hypothetical protein